MSEADYRARLIAARKKLKLSRKQMAKKLLTPWATYRQWETGARRTPGVAVLAAEKLTSRTYSTPKRDQIAALADGTLTAREIADRIGSTRQRVHNHLHRLRKSGKAVAIKKLNPGPPPGELLGNAAAVLKVRRPSPKRDQIAVLADGTLTVREIAAQVGSTPKSVHSHLIKLRKSGKAVTTKRDTRGRPSGEQRLALTPVGSVSPGSPVLKRESESINRIDPVSSIFGKAEKCAP